MRIFAALLLALSCHAAPDWYGNIKPKGYEIIGYGEAQSAKEARAIALEDVSSRLKTKVDSSFVSTTVLKNADVNISKSLSLKVGSKSDTLWSGEARRILLHR